MPYKKYCLNSKRLSLLRKWPFAWIIGVALIGSFLFKISSYFAVEVPASTTYAPQVTKQNPLSLLKVKRNSLKHQTDTSNRTRKTRDVTV